MKIFSKSHEKGGINEADDEKGRKSAMRINLGKEIENYWMRT